MAMRNGHRRNGSSRRARTLLSSTTGRVAGSISQFGRVVSGKAVQAAETITEKGRDVAKAAKRAKNQVRNYINGNPMPSVLIGLGIGVLFGFILRRRGCSD